MEAKKYCEICKLHYDPTGLRWPHEADSEHNYKKKRLEKLAQWYCATCETQCRGKREWENHLKMKKHLKGRVDYHCAKCDYSTQLTHLIKQHEQTKKHLGDVKAN